MIETDRPREVAHAEPGYLWGDLHEGRRNAIRDRWSVQCDGKELMLMRNASRSSV
ncbi:hypothetical protein C5F59_000085 [Streptomyces sp. QL37]|uniref:hypothetical protein n=1 Tax=Streptomyces sp. QL37 TaxID=2093747 RepID=UPI00137500A7|nr:hypothetical protein [Streptomyces sp. QL37]